MEEAVEEATNTLLAMSEIEFQALLRQYEVDPEGAMGRLAGLKNIEILREYIRSEHAEDN